MEVDRNSSNEDEFSTTETILTNGCKQDGQPARRNLPRRRLLDSNPYCDILTVSPNNKEPSITDKANVMVRENQQAGILMQLSRVPNIGERIKTISGRELEVLQVVHIPYGSHDAEVDVQ